MQCNDTVSWLVGFYGMSTPGSFMPKTLCFLDSNLGANALSLQIRWKTKARMQTTVLRISKLLDQRMRPNTNCNDTVNWLVVGRILWHVNLSGVILCQRRFLFDSFLLGIQFFVFLKTHFFKHISMISCFDLFDP